MTLANEGASGLDLGYTTGEMTSEPRPGEPARYDHAEVEARWQRTWEEAQTFRATRDRARPKRYVLDMFPYP